jgi:hypothetical protein
MQAAVNKPGGFPRQDSDADGIARVETHSRLRSRVHGQIPQDVEICSDDTILWLLRVQRAKEETTANQHQ